MSRPGRRSARASGSHAPQPNIWQRRWLEKHFAHFSDEELAGEAALSVAQVRDYLSLIGAERSATQTQRIARRVSTLTSASASARQSALAPAKPPTCWTPSRVRQHLITPRTRTLDRRDLWLVATMFLVSAVLYVATAARTVTGEDAGELIAAAHGLGVAHPPGYPLWTLLAHAAEITIPFGTAAWRVTLASALPAAIANALLLALGLKALHHRVAAVVGAGVFACSLTHWSQATIAEVYGLNTALIVGMVLLVVRFVERPTARRLFALAAVAGVSATNHTSAIPVAALAASTAVFVAPKLVFRPPVMLTALACLAAPLTLYAYLPWAASHNPYLNWGDPSSWAGFVEHITRSQYAAVEASSRAATSYADYLSRLGVLWDALLRQLGSPLVPLLAVAGFFTLAVRRTGLWLLLITLGWLCSVGITQYASYSMGREHVYAVAIFFIPAWMVLSFLVGGGLDALLLAAKQRWSERGVQSSALGAAALLIGLPAIVNLPHVDRSETTLVADYGRALLDSMEPGSLYFPSSDHSTFSVLYWQGVEGYRSDVVVADKYGSIDEQLIAEYVSEEERRAADLLPGPQRRARWEMLLTQRWAGPVYFAGRRVMADLPGYTLEPAGPLFRVMEEAEAERWWGEPAAAPAAEPLVGPIADPPGLAAWLPLAHLDLDDPAEGLDFTVQMIRGDLHAMKGFALLRAERLDAAEAEWSEIRGDLAPLKQTFNNIGSALADAGRTEEALAYYDRALIEDAGYALALRNAAAVHRRRGESSAAIDKLRRLVRLDSTARTERLLLARTLGSDGQLEAALAQYEALARQDLADPLPWREAGKLLEQGGDFGGAQDAYTESLARNPEQPQIAQALDRIRQGVSQLMAQLPADLANPGATAFGLGAGLESGPANEPLLDPTRADFGAPPMPQLPGSAQGTIPMAPQPPNPVADLRRAAANPTGGHP